MFSTISILTFWWVNSFLVSSVRSIPFKLRKEKCASILFQLTFSASGGTASILLKKNLEDVMNEEASTSKFWMFCAVRRDAGRLSAVAAEHEFVPRRRGSLRAPPPSPNCCPGACRPQRNLRLHLGLGVFCAPTDCTAVRRLVHLP